MGFESHVAPYVDKLLGTVSPEWRRMIIANEPIVFNDFYKNPMIGAPKWGKETILNSMAQNTSNRIALLNNEGVAFKSAKDSLMFIDKVLRNPAGIKQWDVNGLMSQLGHNRYINNMLGFGEYPLLSNGLHGQMEFMNNPESFLKHLKGDERRLFEKSFEAWNKPGKRLADARIAKLGGLMQNIQIRSALKHPMAGITAEAARRGLYLENLPQIEGFIQGLGKERQWNNNVISDFIKMAKEKSVVHKGKIIGYVGGGNFKPLMLTGGVNQIVPGNQTGIRRFGTTDWYDIFGLEGGAKRSIVTVSELEVNNELFNQEHKKNVTKVKTYKGSGAIGSFSKKGRRITDIVKDITKHSDEVLEAAVGSSLRTQRVGPNNWMPMAKAIVKMGKGAAPVLVGLASYKLLEKAFEKGENSKVPIGSGLVAYKT